MLEIVSDTIKKNNLINKGDRVIAGISGGPDSVCLLHVLHLLAHSMDISLYAAHINHMLRGEESDGDQEYVEQLCKDLGIPVYVKRIDIKAIAREKGCSLEEAGREARYSYFETVAKELGGASIAVAHNKNDQAETVLMHILRGTGLEGLKGMDYKRGNIIRPLLDVERWQIEEYCAKNALNPRKDSSNAESIYTRNKIRLHLIPEIDRMFGGNIVRSIVKMAALLRDDNNFIEISTDMAYNQCAVKKSSGGIELNMTQLADLHPSIKKRVIRKAIKEVKGDLKEIESIHVDAVLELAASGRTGAMLQLPGNIRIRRSYNALKIDINEYTQDFKHFSSELVIPGITFAECIDAFLEASIIDDMEANLRGLQMPQNSMVQFFDYDKFKPGINIMIRNRREGDIFRPFRSSGTKKLKEFLIDNKIERELRNKIPLIACGNEIVWVIGYKISDKFKVTDNTKRVLKLTFKFNNDSTAKS